MASGQELIAVACSNMDNQQLWKFDFANNEWPFKTFCTYIQNQNQVII